jgi:transcriptional regulator
MHIPNPYRTEDKEVLKQIIAENAFAMVISHHERIHATHTMMMYNEDDTDRPYVETHISMTNPQAKEIKNGDLVLCDFLGHNTYVSSSWYSHINASTWNYEAVQIYGKVELMTDRELYKHLEKLTNKFENNQKCQMTVAKMGDEFVLKAMKGAFGFKIFPEKVDIAQKFSQNRNEKDFKNIICELENSNNPEDGIMAEKMNKLLKS